MLLLDAQVDAMKLFKAWSPLFFAIIISACVGLAASPGLIPVTDPTQRIEFEGFRSTANPLLQTAADYARLSSALADLCHCLAITVRSG
jgi:hypothetical protein